MDNEFLQRVRELGEAYGSLLSIQEKEEFFDNLLKEQENGKEFTGQIQQAN